jgi:hypothetical protein
MEGEVLHVCGAQTGMLLTQCLSSLMQCFSKISSPLWSAKQQGGRCGLVTNIDLYLAGEIVLCC